MGIHRKRTGRKSVAEGSGPIATDPKAWNRSVRLDSYFTPGMAADLLLIARAWDCTPAAVVWAVIATWVNETCRDRDVLQLPYGQSSKRILATARALEQAELEEEFG